MSETKYTKGKWRVQVEQPYPHTLSQILTVVTDNFDVVCVPHGIRNQNDAHLIAAAPEMYADIEDDIKELSHELKNKNLTPHTRAHLTNKLNVKTKLLAKARGES